jgi:hypothetical protein
MKNPVRFAIWIIVAHLVLNYFHGAAHRALAIGITPAERRYVVIVILFAPVVAGVLLLLKARRAGGWLLAAAMAGSLAFSVYKHFIAAGPDNAFSLAPSAWGALFQITAVLLAVVEALGCWAGIRLAMPPAKT